MEQKLLLSLCCKYGLEAYRYKGQRHTTTMVRVSKQFMDEVLWPEFEKYDTSLDEFAEIVTSKLIQQIHFTEGEPVERALL